MDGGGSKKLEDGCVKIGAKFNYIGGEETSVDVNVYRIRHDPKKIPKRGPGDG